MTNLLTGQKRWLSFLGIILAMFLGALDQTIISAALPRVVADLNGLDRYSWVITAYLMTSTALVPIYGKLADMYSRRTLEITAITLFLTASGLCGLAGQFGPLPVIGDGMQQLILFRGLQGIGGAGLFALALIIVADLFDAKTRSKYQGYLGAVFGIASVVGPLLGGFLTDQGTGLLPGVAGWRLIFYVNMPVGVVALWLVSRYMPALRPTSAAASFDIPSALLLVSGISLLVVLLQDGRNLSGSQSIYGITLAGGAVITLGIFIWRSLHHPNPVLAFHLFRNGTFRAATSALFLIGGAFMSVIVFEPLFMIHVLGESATRAGVSLMPLSLGIVIGSVSSGYLVARFGNYQYWLLGSLLLLGLGIWQLYTMPPTVNYYQVLSYIALCGVGFGPTSSLYTLAVQNAVDAPVLGQATSATQFFRQMGGTIGTAVLGALLTASLSSHLPALNQLATDEPGTEGSLSVSSPVVQTEIARVIQQLYGYTLYLIVGASLITLFIVDFTPKQVLQDYRRSRKFPIR